MTSINTAIRDTIANLGAATLVALLAVTTIAPIVQAI